MDRSPGTPDFSAALGSNMALDFHGFDLTHPVNRIPSGRVSIAQNIRAYFSGGVSFRNLLTGALYTLAAAVHTIRRLNDSTPNGPSSGYTLINGAGAVLYAGGTSVATGLSTNPVSMVPFRPNASVQGWMYVGDSAAMGTVTLQTKYLISGSAVNFPSNGMMKVRSDGLVYKMGIEEPQLAPVVSTSNSVVSFGGGSGNLLATTIPWTNYPINTNNSDDYGETEGPPNTTPPVDGTAPFIINCQNASTITITALALDGTVVINGTTNPTLTATSSGRVAAGAPGYPGQFIETIGTGLPPTAASYVVGAFTDGAGNVVAAGVAPLYIPNIVDVGVAFGTSTPITVPYGAAVFQVGINSEGNTFTQGSPPNSGLITFAGTVTTNALPTVTSILGTLTLNYWGDSPTSGPVSAYIWKNPGDPGGSGPERSTSNAVGSTTGNSFIFDATFTSGIPSLPGIGSPSVPMEWTTLSPESVAIGTNPVFAAPITVPAPQNTNNTQFANFNFCLTGNIYFPGPGYYALILTNKDDCIWGIGGGIKPVVVAAFNQSGSVPSSLSQYGQTITVVGGYPLLPRANTGSGLGGQYVYTLVTVNVPAAGIYPIEIDYDYWYHSGRILLLMVSPIPSSTPAGVIPPTIVPPLPANVREETQYRYVYRSSATGALSNPSPESVAESIPVLANTITSFWSNDPQVDVVDYYRVDTAIDNFTYVCTGPNDDLGGGGTNTAVSDSLLDTAITANPVLQFDNYEPFPSIDLPQKGICSVSGGVISWVSGGAIGGTATGFNARWLAGTVILIGSPTSLAYTFIARPTAAAFQINTYYGSNWIVTDPAGHYQLVTVAGISGGSSPAWNDSGGPTTSGGVTFADKGFYTPAGFVSQVTIPGVPNGTNLVYEIAEPILAAQPLPYIWGPTDNINFVFAVGDPLRPGTLYWCSGSNLDSAPDTNQMDVTDPGEPLVNGAMSGGRGVLFSIRRAWVIMPNFFNALATVTGTTGSTWTLQATSINRGLFIPRCVAVEGSGLIFFRVDDGIHLSSGGGASRSITDQDLYPIFPHENEDGGTSVPQPVTRQGVTVYPPDDSQPQKQKFSIINGYLYYDYIGLTDGNPHTLVFDIQAMGWVWDLYTPPATIHATNEGVSQQGVLVGCSDGTIRQLASGGTETGTAIVQTAAIGGTGWQTLGPVLIVEYSSSTAITLTGYAADAGNGSYGPTAITIPSSGGAMTKLKLVCGASKWKLLWFQFSSTAPFQLNLEGFVVQTKDWGSTGAYKEIQPFAENGGGG